MYRIRGGADWLAAYRYLQEADSGTLNHILNFIQVSRKRRDILVSMITKKTEEPFPPAIASGVAAINKISANKIPLKSFGYGFFIPLFFIFTGAKVDIPYLFSEVDNIGIMLLIISVGILSKLIGVFVVTKLNGFNIRESIAFGLFHSARLSLIIAAANIARELDLIDNNLFSIFVILAVVTSTLFPTLARYILTAERKLNRGALSQGPQ